jgi:crossover junction endodeoxyribonuclease RuvC
MILCLDLGTTTGWATANDGVIYSGSVNFKPSRFESHGIRYIKFKAFLDEHINHVSHLYYEEVRNHAGIDAAHMYGGYMATLQTWAIKRDIPYEGVPVGTIKKHLTGKGNASKEDMIAAVTLLGFAPKDDNQADALALCLYALKKGRH